MSVQRRTWAAPILSASAAAAAIFLSTPVSLAQEKLSFRVEDEVTRFAFSTDGRVACSVRHVFSEKKVQLQRDDIWIAERDGKKRRILQGEKFVRGSGPFSYLVRGLRWSPDGTRLTVELATSEMINQDGDTREGVATLLLDDSGREIATAGDSLIPGAINAVWLTGATGIAYLTTQPVARPPLSEPPPKSDRPANNEGSFVVNRIREASGPGAAMFSGEQFAAVSWNPAKNFGVAIQRGPALPNMPAGSSPAELVGLDLDKETRRDLAKLDGYAGGLSLSPSGEKIAYWVGNEQLEVREMGAPSRVARVRVVLGTLAWAGDEKRILIKQGPVGRSGSLVWAPVPPLVSVAAGATPATQDVPLRSILHDLEFRQFDISPDGKSLGVIEPGRRNLLVYSLD